MWLAHIKVYGVFQQDSQISMTRSYYHLVMTNIAMENPQNKWRFLAGKIINKWAIYTMAMLNNQRVPILGEHSKHRWSPGGSSEVSISMAWPTTSGWRQKS